MPDISMCIENKNCKSKEICYRATAIPSELQSYCMFFKSNSSSCEFFLSMEKNQYLYSESGIEIVRYSLEILKRYLAEAGDYIELESEISKIKHNGKEMTFKAAVEFVIEDFQRIMDDDFEDCKESMSLFTKLIQRLWY